MKRRILFLAALFAAISIHAEPIDDATFVDVMRIADREGVPRSVAARLMFEESGDPWTGSRGNPKAVGNEPSGYTSGGLFQLHMKPENIDYLERKYWIERGETEKFDIWNPRHNATVAMRYLSDLHERFKTWFLAACYYNAGPPSYDWIAKKYRPKVITERTRRYARRIVNAKEPRL